MPFLGIWLVGNIGREQGSIWVALAISYLTYPTLYYFDDSSTCIGCVAFCASLGFDHFSKEWRLKKKERRSYKKKLAIFTLFFLVYSGLWVSYFYFNATITDSEGEEIKLSEAIKHFLTSPIWLDLTVISSVISKTLIYRIKKIFLFFRQVCKQHGSRLKVKDFGLHGDKLLI